MLSAQRVRIRFRKHRVPCLVLPFLLCQGGAACEDTGHTWACTIQEEQQGDVTGHHQTGPERLLSHTHSPWLVFNTLPWTFLSSRGILLTFA